MSRCARTRVRTPTITPARPCISKYIYLSCTRTCAGALALSLYLSLSLSCARLLMNQRTHNRQHAHTRSWRATAQSGVHVRELAPASGHATTQTHTHAAARARKRIHASAAQALNPHVSVCAGARLSLCAPACVGAHPVCAHTPTPPSGALVCVRAHARPLSLPLSRTCKHKSAHGHTLSHTHTRAHTHTAVCFASSLSLSLSLSRARTHMLARTGLHERACARVHTHVRTLARVRAHTHLEPPPLARTRGAALTEARASAAARAFDRARVHVYACGRVCECVRAHTVPHTPMRRRSPPRHLVCAGVCGRGPHTSHGMMLRE